MKKRYALLASMIAAVVFGILFLLVSVVLREQIIIHLHYSTWKTCRTAALVPFAAFALLSIILGISYANASGKEKKELIKKELEQESRRREKKREISTPEVIYQYIRDELLPDQEIARECRGLLSQLDQMNKAQEKLDHLLEMNDMTGLEQSKIVLQKMEDAMCSECRTLINKYIVGGAGPFRQGMDASYRLNAERLSKVQALLNTMAEYANGKISGSDATSFLDSYMSVIREEITEADSKGPRAPAGTGGRF